MNSQVILPFWKRWLSYVFPLQIERTSSELNPELQVVYQRGRYQLLSNNAVYSYDDLYSNFDTAFRHVKDEVALHSDILLLGLGLASVPYILEYTFRMQFQMTSIELDAEVIRLASKYTLPRLKSPVEVIQADALHFMAGNQRRFHLIVMDVFVDETVPEEFEEEAFHMDLQRSLHPGGMVLFNRLYGTRSDRIATDRFLQGAKLWWSDIEEIKSGENRVIKLGK